MPQTISFRGTAFLMVLALLSISAAALPAHAQTQDSTTTGWVKSATIGDLTGNSQVTSSQAFLAGHSYNVTMQISVPNTQNGVQFQASINPKLGPAAGQSQFWQVKTPNYGGYAASTFTGGNRVATFNQVLGNFTLSSYFSIPVNFTLSLNGTRDLAQNNVAVISIVPIGGSPTGGFAADVQDQTIQKYLTTYNDTSTLVPSGKIPQTYAPLVSSIITQAQTLYTLGLPSQATDLLNTVVPSAFPTPPSNSLQTDLLGGLAGAVIVIILLAVVMVRGRGKQGYTVGVVGDVAKELAVLEVTAAKYDKALADRLKSLRDKLGETS